MGIDDTQDRLKLQKRHVSITPIGDGVFFSQHIFINGYIYRFMNQFADFGWPCLMMINL